MVLTRGIPLERGPRGLPHRTNFHVNAPDDQGGRRPQLWSGHSLTKGTCEVEALKELSFLSGMAGDWINMFFVQANLTLQDSELVAGEKADAPTNDIRPLAGASEYVASGMLGFDSDDGRHTATLVCNVFGERLYVAGRLGATDGYE